MEENQEIETLELDEVEQPTVIEQPPVETYSGNTSHEEKPPKKKRTAMIVSFLLCIVIVVALIVVLFLFGNKKNKKEKVETDKQEVQSEYRMSSNALENFDLNFLKQENGDKNVIYSPLSIKYTLAMLKEGANGTTKNQIEAVVGDYTSKKYENSSNMSFANAMFVRDSFKNDIKDTYTDKLNTKYNAELIFDTFETPDTINNWAHDKTLGLISNLVDDVSSNQFFLLNALAIDMEWKQKIQMTSGDDLSNLYSVRYNHENYSEYIPVLFEDKDYKSLPFNNNSMNAKAVEIGASINRYDIIKELGEENIRNTITKEYTEWVAQEEQRRQEISQETGYDYSIDPLTPVDEYVNQFIEELKENYNRVDYSTDFMLYDDTKVKAFAKDLKEYNGTTLQYIGVMPKEDINTYIQEMDAKSLNEVFDNLKEIKVANFTDGKVTRIIGTIPVFQFDYELDLMNDLKTLGIQDVFDTEKADLSKLTSTKGVAIDKAIHKANIEFSNEGIKASAITAMGGFGAAGGGFEHLYEVPIETIDLTFDNPYIFFIRDKNTGEIWFMGKVYQPTEK